MQAMAALNIALSIGAPSSTSRLLQIWVMQPISMHPHSCRNCRRLRCFEFAYDQRRKISEVFTPPNAKLLFITY